MMHIKKYWDSSRDDFSNRPTILFQPDHLGFLSECKKIIDLGSGNGILVNKLNEMGHQAHGITYNQGEVNQRVHQNVIFGDMQDIPFEDDTFDGFVMWDSLEHCPSAYIALCEARRVVKDNGKGLIFMPGLNWLNCHCHITCYTVPQMEQLFRQSGWTLNKVHEKKYPNEPNKYCEGMAVYEVINVPGYKAVFEQ
jgi:ubiquinone/menaquinone biosynthesis C-methylase UbiE